MQSLSVGCCSCPKQLELHYSHALVLVGVVLVEPQVIVGSGVSTQTFLVRSSSPVFRYTVASSCPSLKVAERIKA